MFHRNPQIYLLENVQEFNSLRKICIALLMPSYRLQQTISQEYINWKILPSQIRSTPKAEKNMKQFQTSSVLIETYLRLGISRHKK